jgi:hypothetical protein
MYFDATGNVLNPQPAKAPQAGFPAPSNPSGAPQAYGAPELSPSGTYYQANYYSSSGSRMNLTSICYYLSGGAGTHTSISQLTNYNPVYAATGLTFGGISGNIGVNQMNSGTMASSSTFWRGDGVWATPAGGGNVTGAATSTNGDIVLFNGTSGTIIQDSGTQLSSLVTTSSLTSTLTSYVTSSSLSSTLSAYQTSLGFTPVQQGGGTNQGTNKVRIGWDSTATGRLRYQVDVTDLGDLANYGDIGNSITTMLSSSFSSGSGYFWCNGTMVQYGVISSFSGGSGTTVNYPFNTNFPNNCLFVMASHQTPRGSVYAPATSLVDRTQFGLYAENGNAYWWLAIGY